MEDARKRPPSLLFVCTGNVFRSVAAEFALKATLKDPSSCLVGSAGIDAKPQSVHEWVKRCLREKGADVNGHRQRRLTRELMEQADVVVAMSCDHRDFIAREFGCAVPLFKQVCYGRDEPILDLHELYPNWEEDLTLAQAYVASVIDMIWKDMPSFVSKFPHVCPPSPRLWKT